MSTTIEIEQSTFSLLKKVEGRGVSLDDLLREALRNTENTPHFQRTASPNDWIKSLRKWTGRSRVKGAIPDEALRREHLYDDRA